jgi:predicted ATPase with chaperone activity
VREQARIDIHCEVPRVDYDKLTSDRLGEPSEAVRDRVEAACASTATRVIPRVDAAGKALLLARCFTATRCRSHAPRSVWAVGVAHERAGVYPIVLNRPAS